MGLFRGLPEKQMFGPTVDLHPAVGSVMLGPTTSPGALCT